MTVKDPLDDLLHRLAGWSLLSAIPAFGSTEVRLATPVATGSDIVARAMLLVDSDEPSPTCGSYLGGPLTLVDDAVDIAGWRQAVSSVFAGQIVDTSICVAPSIEHDPVAEADQTADHLMEHGTLLWPPPEDLPEPDRGLEPLEAVTRQALTASPLILTIESDGPGRPHQTSHLYLTAWAALELTSGVVDGAVNLVASTFPPTEMIGRLWERTGLHRHLSIGATTALQQEVTVRITYGDDTGLVIGALQWNESSDGTLTCSDGVRSAMSVASELLTMFPGGEVAPDEPSDAEDARQGSGNDETSG